MIINLEVIAVWITTVGAILSPIIFVIKNVMKKYNDINKKLEAINSWTDHQQKDIEDSKQNRLALNKSLLYVAESMKAQGFNGTIDKAIETLKDTIFKQHADGVSYPERKGND
jgi:hypothetical protein